MGTSRNGIPANLLVCTGYFSMQRHSGRFYAGTKGGGNKEGNENEIRNREEWRGGDE